MYALSRYDSTSEANRIRQEKKFDKQLRDDADEDQIDAKFSLYYKKFNERHYKVGRYTWELDSKICGDGVGGVWILENGDLLHYSDPKRELDKKYSGYPSDCRLQHDGKGNLFVLMHGQMWFVSRSSERKLFDLFPQAQRVCQMATTGAGGVWLLALDKTFLVKADERTYEKTAKYAATSDAKLKKNFPKKIFG